MNKILQVIVSKSEENQSNLLLMFLLMQILLYEIHHSPVHKYQFLFENGDFFSAVWPTVDTYSAETVTGNASFLKGSPE